MSVSEALRHVHSVDIPHVGEFCAATIGELYENVIRLNRLNHDTMLQWWRVLRDYTMGNRALRVFVRKLEREQRRGFVSCLADGLSYVFCDNSFAKVIYGLAREPCHPRDVADFTAAVNSLRFKCLHCSHGDERDAVDNDGNRYCVYRNGAMPNFHGEWKLAHIIGVNQFYLGNYADFQDRYFQPGELEDWSYDRRYGFVVRNIDNIGNQEDRVFFISHFLRFSNPMNYFLIPRNHHVGMNGFARDISEDVNLLEYMRQLREEEFGDVWTDFERSVRFSGFGVGEDRLNLSGKRINFTCHPSAAAQMGHTNHCMGENAAIGNRQYRRRTYDIVVNQQVILEDLPMRQSVLCAIQHIAGMTPDISFETLKNIFPKRVNRYHETVILADECHDSRRYIGPINLGDGRQICVCGEWIGNGPRANWPLFVAAAAAVGVDIVEHRDVQ